MTVKLHINISQGLIEVEGDADFVREIYADYRDQLLNGEPEPRAIPQTKHDVSIDLDDPAKQRPKLRRRALPKRKANADDQGLTVSADHPKLDKDLDTSALPSFYGQFEAKNNSEKILIFLRFITDELQIESPNTDQIYTCFEKVDERVPKAFAQAFYDASGKKFGYIDYKSPIDVRLTTIGSNHFKFDLKRKTVE